MLRVTTLHASSAAATAAYYAQYLTAAPGEVPGVWSGRQAAGLGLSGRVDEEALEALLSGRDPTTGTRLGRELLDRYTTDGRLVRAVSGFDATFSAPKSLSVWWALTGDHRLLEAHDVAVASALAHLERFGSTTRIRADGARLHPDTNGLTIATFRQTTSRADDPQIHTHAVISAKVQTPDGRWCALDARYLKRHQRMLGGLYQSVLRAELAHRFGVEWRPIRNGQAEIAGVPDELLAVFSKRTAEIEGALADKVDDFRQREGREPSRWERAALTREASADTRSRKSGHGAGDLTTRWRTEAANAGWTVELVDASIDDAAGQALPSEVILVPDVIDAVSEQRSSWCRADVLQAICDAQRPVSHQSGHGWAATVERATDHVVAQLVDLDPPGATTQRSSDGRSVWIEPTAPRFTSEPVLAQEEAIVTWAMAAQADPPAPSATVNGNELDPLQADAAAAVAGDDRLVLVVGPAGGGKTRMLTAAGGDLEAHGRVVLAVAPTAKAARTIERDTGMAGDTVAKLLHEWQRSDRPPLPELQLPPGATLIVDEAGMLSTPALHQLVGLADRNRWRLALVGDPRQLQGVGRGGMLAELCANGRVETLERLHRFRQAWEAAASLQLRCGDPRALDAYEAHGRIVAGTLDKHLHRLAAIWIDHHDTGHRIAVVASTNDHVATINQAIQTARLTARHLAPTPATPIAAGEFACVGDVIATRRNDRRLHTGSGEPVRNRDTWTVTAIHHDRSITVTHHSGHGSVTLPADYVRQHVRLGYAATEHGWQSDTVDTAIALTSPATTRRGLYVAATRGAESNLICVVTDSDDIAEARDVLDAIVAGDRADIPATTQRRALAQSVPRPLTPEAATPTSRCDIPDWFPAVHAAAQHALRDAETREAQHTVRRAQAAAAAAGADSTLADVAAATAVDRDALHHAEARAVQARRHHAAAQRRLDSAPRRQRRGLRRDLATAERLLDRAEDYLARTRQRTTPAVDRHTHALANQRDAHDQLRNCGTIDLLDTMAPSVGEQRLHVQALTTWQRWAQGHDLPDGILHATFDVLARQPGAEQQLTITLRNDLAGTSVDRAPHLTDHRDHPGVHVAHQDFGIEL
jgi:conjugative relaxase-like TrwC/TraI family protein